MNTDKPTSRPTWGRLFGTDAHSDKLLPLNAVKRRAARALGRFDRYVRRELAKCKVVLPPALNLVSHQHGEVRLGTDHPQGDAITVWLTGNAKLTKRFKEVEVLFEIVRAAENPGVILADNIRFFIGLTSAGPIAYFETHPRSN